MSGQVVGVLSTSYRLDRSKRLQIQVFLSTFAVIAFLVDFVVAREPITSIPSESVISTDAARSKRGSFAPPRPISAYSLPGGVGGGGVGGGSSTSASADAALGSPGFVAATAHGDVRKSVAVGNDFGGFLAVPAPSQGPSSPRSGSRRGSRVDLWR